MNSHRLNESTGCVKASLDHQSLSGQAPVVFTASSQPATSFLSLTNLLLVLQNYLQI
jgi:hypothetical protein